MAKGVNKINKLLAKDKNKKYEPYRSKETALRGL
jgi:hypothetical protein